jgi:hypothetical protein
MNEFIKEFYRIATETYWNVGSERLYLSNAIIYSGFIALFILGIFQAQEDAKWEAIRKRKRAEKEAERRKK